ncbi:metallodipeptidase [Malassezia pachydermatis]|uniref:Cndp dipeptidase n=1 Tax=Malassezia pachydermatis TaxID=77020 RepID=A0A0M8MV62_9BASI|nr:cndp dipeptidase [Malassezia pachydermatis]KOS14400.1 cndp dipeptidase [Malassezia pachydermatis]
MSENQTKFVDYIEKNQDKLVKSLAEVVAIPSVSGDPAYRQDVFRQGEWIKAKLLELGAEATTHDLGMQKLDGKDIPLPPVVVGSLGNDSSKKTVLVYGHYDVQPALKSDGWNTEPFELVHDEKTGRLYGRGSTDDKGPILGWLHTIEAHKTLGLELPVNLKFCFEGMEESGSNGLDEFVTKNKDTLFSGVDAVCISDNYWLGTKKPCVTNGLRGISYFKLSISGPARDLHSGVFGGMVHEPMTDLIKIMSSLVTPQGEITIPGINEQVKELTDDERKVYDVMDFSISDVDDATGSQTTISDNKPEVLMARMRFPSLSLHGIEGAFAEPGSKTVIPAKVTGKFSLRLVPNMDPAKVIECVQKHVESEFAKLKSKNTMHLAPDHPGKPWVADPNHWNYEAAFRATEKIYGVRPDLTKEGGSIPITLTFADALNKNVLLLPMGRSDDGAHSTNEKLDLSNYVKGTQLLGTYLYEIAAATA